MRYRANLLGTLGTCVVAALAVAWGWFDAGGLRGDMPGHATALICGAIGLLLGLPIVGSHLAIRSRVRAVRAAPEGAWAVTPGDIAAFLRWQRAQGVINAWHPTRAERRHGCDVCWDGEHLVVGAHYLRVGPGQLLPFTAVRCRTAAPATVSLHYWQPWKQVLASVPRVVRTEREFSFPAADGDRARAFVRHFEHRLHGESAPARRQRLRRISNWALGAGACCGLMLAFGLAVAWHDRSQRIYRPTTERATLIGLTTFGLMGMPLLLVGWRVRKR